jgi:hypothetical protein
VSNIQPARRSLAKARIALFGPSGSGKTLSALKLAHGISPKGKIVVIDTESGSGSLYADRPDLGIDFPYYTLPISEPYTAEKYLAAVAFFDGAGENPGRLASNHAIFANHFFSSVVVRCRLSGCRAAFVLALRQPCGAGPECCSQIPACVAPFNCHHVMPRWSG